MSLSDLLDSNSSLKIEISSTDLSKLAAILISYGERKAQSKGGLTPLLTCEEVCAIVRRDRTTLARWHKENILKHNSLGLYTQEDVAALIKK